MYKISNQKEAQEFLIEALKSHDLTIGKCKELMRSVGADVDDNFINKAAQVALQRQINTGHMVSTKNQYANRRDSDHSLNMQIAVEESIMRIQGELPGIPEEAINAAKREAANNRAKGGDELKEAYIQRYEHALSTGDQSYISQVRKEIAKEGYQV